MEQQATQQPTQKPNIRLLVCGGRTFGTVNNNAEDRLTAIIEAQKQSALLCHVLTTIKNENHIELLIEGDAAGADRLAGDWADANHIEHAKFKAQWAVHGNKAGILRNIEMLEKGKPTLVVAFPGGTGTADMVKRAKDAGIKVLEVDYVG